jgi:hypothetical protein
MLPIVQAPDCVPALKAIGEETRVRIVELLLERPLGVDEIAETLGVSQYNVSKHLRILREAGLLLQLPVRSPPEAFRQTFPVQGPLAACHHALRTTISGSGLGGLRLRDFLGLQK